MSQLALYVDTWSGPFIASTPGVPCCSCGRSIRIGERVFYAGAVMVDENRTCAGCKGAAA